MSWNQIDNIYDIIKDSSIKASTLRAYDIDIGGGMKYSKVPYIPKINRYLGMPMIIDSQGQELHYDNESTGASFIESQLATSVKNPLEFSDIKESYSSEPTSDMILESKLSSDILVLEERNMPNTQTNSEEDPVENGTLRFITSSPQLKLSSEPFEYLESEKFEDLLEM